MFLSSSSLLGAKQLWKTAAPPRIRFFFWLVMYGRCWTANRRFRHGLQPDDPCIFCDQSSETMEHILLGCPYSREVWHSWAAKLHLLGYLVVDEGPVMSWWLASRRRLPKPLRKGFDAFFFLVGWLLWKERNARTFDVVATPAARLVSVIKDEADSWCAAGYRSLGLLLERL
jgi:hypothetical protein